MVLQKSPVVHRHNPPAVLSPQFVKIVLQAFIQLKQLRLPLKFVRTYGDEICDVAQLTVSDGRVWKVKVKREGEQIWFENGFDEFVKHYSIRHGYLLIFKFKGMSNFSVHIIDKSSCEIQYPPHKPSMHSEDFTCDYRNNEIIEKDDQSDCLCSPRSCPSTSGSTRKRKLDLPVKNSKTISSVKRRRDFEVETEAKRCKAQELGDENGNLGSEQESQVFVSPKFDEIVQSSSLESKRALNEARTYKPKGDAFMIVIRTDNARDRTKMEAGFAKKYKEIITEEMIKVQITDEENWQSEFSIRPEWRTGGGLVLTEGWSDFVFCNNLEIGGVCIFEVTNFENFVLKAITFRAGME